MRDQPSPEFELVVIRVILAARDLPIRPEGPIDDLIATLEESINGRHRLQLLFGFD